ncbi:MAG: hypothetical protein JO345_27670 [Streptosporangiaceae bacterium]|nr:hypothetical protein [Streptosporangiaceae bacterium]
MFERFTDRARRVVVVAQEEARGLHHNYIGTEHILLGLIRLGEGLGVKTLRSLHIDLDALSDEVMAIIGRGQEAEQQSGHIPFTPRAKKTLEEALRESVRLKSGYIGTEHILLGLLHESDGIAGQVLIANGVTLERARQQVAHLLEPRGGEGRLPQESGGTAFPGLRAASLRVRPSAAALEEIAGQLRIINRRLAAIEAKLGIEDTKGEPPAASA